MIMRAGVCLRSMLKVVVKSLYWRRRILKDVKSIEGTP
jgi:heme exporter protein D